MPTKEYPSPSLGPPDRPHVHGVRMIQGLLVDFGGVLTSPFFDCLRGFCRREGLPDDALVDLISAAALQDLLGLSLG